MKNRLIFTLVLPCTHIHVILIIPLRLSLFGLHFHSEMATARLISIKSITSHKLTYFHKVCNTGSLFKLLVELIIFTWNINICPKIFFKILYLNNSFLKTFFITSHPHIIPHNNTQFLMEIINRFLSFNIKQLIKSPLDFIFRLFKSRIINISLRFLNFMTKIISDSIRKHKIAISKSLHKCRSSQPISTMIADISFANSIQSRYSSLQIIINPQSTHSIVNSRVNHHRFLIRINSSNLFIHLEKVTVTSSYHILSKSLNSRRKIKKNSKT